MQRIILTISCLSTRLLVNCEETCGEYLLPNDPVHFSPSHGSQWRLVALAGQQQDGTIIRGVEGETFYPTVIRGHWAIGELEFYQDPNCEGKKHATLIRDKPVLSPMHTTYSWQDDSPDELPFAAGQESPWYSEMRAIDGCSSSEFWSQCYQCSIPEAWYGVRFEKDEPEATQIQCVKMFQKDADAYTATRVQLQRWELNTESTEGSWIKKGDWTGLAKERRWYVLKGNTTVQSLVHLEAQCPASFLASLVSSYGLFSKSILRCNSLRKMSDSHCQLSFFS